MLGRVGAHGIGHGRVVGHYVGVHASNGTAEGLPVAANGGVGTVDGARGHAGVSIGLINHWLNDSSSRVDEPVVCLDLGFSVWLVGLFVVVSEMEVEI